MRLTLLLALLALFAGCGGNSSESVRPFDAEPDAFRSGVNYAGSTDVKGFAYLAERGAGWIAVIPFGYGQKAVDAPPPGGFRFSRYRGESIAHARQIVVDAHAQGLRTLLKPHLWLMREGVWRHDIAMTNDADWATWFAAYRTYLEPFVAMAQELEVEALCIGTELSGTLGREREWRELIAWIRESYDGPLTYAAHWYKVDEVAFWDALDFVGVQAWFPLVDATGTSEEELVEAWAPWLDRMSVASARLRKPIVFTEFGYRARAGAAVEPASWDTSGPLDVEAQAVAYRAAFRALATARWLEGVFVWKWPSGYAGLAANESPPRRDRYDGAFSPQGYPAEQVIFDAFRAWRPAGE